MSELNLENNSIRSIVFNVENTPCETYENNRHNSRKRHEKKNQLSKKLVESTKAILKSTADVLQFIITCGGHFGDMFPRVVACIHIIFS